MLSYLQAIPTDTIIRTLIVSVLGLSIRFALTYSNQFWASTYHHTLTYVILPVIAMVVTKVIAGNIALALGMVGALSIVRFRNPVKNSFELVMYFALITIGIAATVKMVFAIGLGVFIIFVIIGSSILEKFLFLPVSILSESTYGNPRNDKTSNPNNVRVKRNLRSFVTPIFYIKCNVMKKINPVFNESLPIINASKK